MIRMTNVSFEKFQSVRMAIIKNLQTVNAGEGVEKRVPYCTVGENVK